MRAVPPYHIVNRIAVTIRLKIEIVHCRILTFQREKARVAGWAVLAPARTRILWAAHLAAIAVEMHVVPVSHYFDRPVVTTV